MIFYNEFNGYKLTKGEVLMVLVNNAKPVIETAKKIDNTQLTLREANSMVKAQTEFVRQFNREIRIDLADDAGFDEDTYDRYQGPGAARKYLREYVFQKLQEKQDQLSK